MKTNGFVQNMINFCTVNLEIIKLNLSARIVNVTFATIKQCNAAYIMMSNASFQSAMITLYASHHDDGHPH